MQILTGFKGIATRTALGLISEIGDFARFSHPRELSSWLGIVPSEYSSGQQRHRGHITRTGNRHARRLLIEAAWSYRHPPRLRDRGPQRDQRAWQAEIRLHRRYKHLTSQGETPNHRDGRDRPRAYRLPLGRHHQPTRPPGGSRLTETLDAGGQATAAARRRNLDQNYAIPTRDQSARQLTTGHCPAVPTRASG